MSRWSKGSQGEREISWSQIYKNTTFQNVQEATGFSLLRRPQQSTVNRVNENHRNSPSHGSGCQKSKTKVSAGAVLSDGARERLPCPSRVSLVFLAVSTSLQARGVISCASSPPSLCSVHVCAQHSPFSGGRRSYWIRGPPTQAQHLKASAMTLFPNRATFWGRRD